MNLIENIAVAFNGIKSNKMRSFLTMLGIIIGISAVILITTLGTMIQNTFTGTIDDLGVTNLVQVMLQSKPNSTREQMWMNQSDLISDTMIERMKERFGDEIESVWVTTSAGRGTINNDVNNDDDFAVSLTGQTTEGLEAGLTDLLEGRLISDEDNAKMRYVINIPSDLAETMFGSSRAALGQVVTVNINQGWQASTNIMDFTVVGVYEYEAGMMSGLFSRTYECDIPIATARRLTGGDPNEGYYQYFNLIGAQGVSVSELSADIVEFFNNGFYKNNDAYQVTTYTMEDDLATINSALSLVGFILGMIAGVSLLVGGIGVMNIMLVSVTERTREIGVRKALGAPNTAIRFQFIVESVILCTIGGIIGVILGVILAIATGEIMMLVLADQLGGITLRSNPSAGAIAISVGFSMAIGVFFGYYPANKAAKLDPIDALRYE
ncbi:MAG: ABC transporter permease [Ruminococcus sp.]|jgi:putative ABC transport system permease protein|nr:ABC transporter permease [Ruminococcus sp.]